MLTAPEMLKEYIDRAGLNQATFAKQAGVSTAAVSFWINGLSSPDGSSALLLQSATNGAVPYAAWFSPATAGRKGKRTPTKNPPKATKGRTRARRVA